MRPRLTARLAGSALAALSIVAVSMPASASAPKPLDIVPLDQATVSPDVANAMRRDFGLTKAQVFTRFAQEQRAAAAEKAAEKSLGSSYAGAWFDTTTGKLVVHTTDATDATAASTLGSAVEVRQVAHSQTELDGVKGRIDALAGKSAPAAVTGWYVDVRGNDVVVSVNRNTGSAEAAAFLAKATALSKTVRVVEVNSSPRTYADVVGAWPYYINGGSRCSMGFAVTVGFVTAGHCGQPGYSVTSHLNEYLGAFEGSVFPGNDHAWVRTVGGVNLYGLVYGYNGSYYYVYGSNELPVNAGVCRSGSTTGMWCGTILAKNQTVNYPQGTVYGLTQTNVCAEPGDSGGSWLGANQAQGVTSGGSGNCSSGGTTYFQPVNPILSYYGLQLVTSG
jgi:streptogrisin C